MRGGAKQFLGQFEALTTEIARARAGLLRNDSLWHPRREAL